MSEAPNVSGLSLEPNAGRSEEEKAAKKAAKAAEKAAKEAEKAAKVSQPAVPTPSPPHQLQHYDYGVRYLVAF